MSGLRLFLIFFLGCGAQAWFSTSLAPHFWGIAPQLLLILTISVAVTSGRRAGELIGFFWGFYLDVVGIHVFGANCLLFTILGYFAGNLRRHMDVHQALPHAAVVFVATLAYHIFWAALALLFDKRFMLPTWTVFFLQPLLNALLAPFVLAASAPRKTRGGYA